MSKAIEMINRMAPILRMLLAEDKGCPIIRFAEKSLEPDVTVAVPDDTGQEQIIELLRAAIRQPSQSIKAVCVEGVGAFEALYPEIDSAGKVSGKVAIVTGAAQGFGLEIAQDLAQQGAAVVLADINEAEAHQQALRLQREYDSNRALGVGIDVTRLVSVERAISAVLGHYGGFDVFISNAGVLKAESVKTQSEKDFEHVCAVNYKGYFLCTQVVSKVLALQHKVNPDYRSDIIQINSKSGLVGSNRNGAYAGSKFGGIGLTQSFALELIEDGVKVNSICPGNFFDGPLWSDRDNGLFVQYLRARKVPGAKTLDDVRRFYEGKVPMGRGCRTEDVMKAIYYLIEQNYETGQAVPVTGGQVMLH